MYGHTLMRVTDTHGAHSTPCRTALVLFWGLNLSCEAWQQAPLSAAPSHWSLVEITVTAVLDAQFWGVRKSHTFESPPILKLFIVKNC